MSYNGEANQPNGYLGLDGQGYGSIEYINGVAQFKAAAQAVGNVVISSPVSAVFDTYTANAGDVILLNSQTDNTENGPYVFLGTGVPMTRVFNCSLAEQFVGSSVQVAYYGGVNSGSLLFCTLEAGATIGTDPIVYVENASDIINTQLDLNLSNVADVNVNDTINDAISKLASSAQGRATQPKSADYTMLITDLTVIAQSAGITITLPDAVNAVNGDIYYVYNASSGIIYVTGLLLGNSFTVEVPPSNTRGYLTSSSLFVPI